MNKSKSLHDLATRFVNRILKSKSLAQSDVRFVERFSFFCISQLNNFMRAYIFSLRRGAKDSQGNVVTFRVFYPTEDALIDDIIKYGRPRAWKPKRIGTWRRGDEPAYHCPRVLVSILSALCPSNKSIILSAMVDSWKVDALREVRNYFAHRNRETEDSAVNFICSKYSVPRVRASMILMENDPSICMRIADDMADYLTDFAKDIC